MEERGVGARRVAQAGGGMWQDASMLVGDSGEGEVALARETRVSPVGNGWRPASALVSQPSGLEISPLKAVPSRGGPLVHSGPFLV